MVWDVPSAAIALSESTFALSFMSLQCNFWAPFGSMALSVDVSISLSSRRYVAASM